MTVYEELLRLANRAHREAETSKDPGVAQAWREVVILLDHAADIAGGL